MSDNKINVLKLLYETSSLKMDKDIFDDIIVKASEQGIKTSVRSLKNYKKEFGWKNETVHTIEEGIEKLTKEKKAPVIIKTAQKKAKKDKPLNKVPDERINTILLEQKLTEVTAFILQGASKQRIYKHYKEKGENITLADVDRLSQEAYNIFASVAPQQRETILGINYERLNMLFELVVAEMRKPNQKSTGFLAGKAVQILGEMNQMFGIRSINLNINNTDGIKNKINQMSPEEKMQRIIELNQKDDGTYGE